MEMPENFVSFSKLETMLINWFRYLFSVLIAFKFAGFLDIF